MQDRQMKEQLHINIVTSGREYKKVHLAHDEYTYVNNCG